MSFFFRSFQKTQHFHIVKVAEVIQPTPIDTVEGTDLPDVVKKHNGAYLRIATVLVLLSRHDMTEFHYRTLVEPTYSTALASELHVKGLGGKNGIKHLLVFYGGLLYLFF